MSAKTRSTSPKQTGVPVVHVTLAMFDSNEPIYRVAREGEPIEDFRPLGFEDYVPSAMTPLRDAAAQFIAHLDRLRAPDRVTIGLLLDESGSMAVNREAVVAGVNEFVGGMRDVDAIDPASAGRVLAVIVTDGLENSSREVDPATLAKSIEDHERDGWTFIYLGANQDAWAVAEHTGFSGTASGQAVAFQATPAGTRAAMASAGGDAREYLGGVEEYAIRRRASARRSVTEQGEEVLTNLGAQQPGFGDVRKAVEEAKEATHR